MCHKAMPFVIWRVCWPQDVANMRKKLKSLSFSRDSEVHAFCDWRAGWPQDVANLRNKLKSLGFSRVSEVALGPF